MKEYLFNQLILSPKEIKKLINLEVKIETDTFMLDGYLKTIDPVSKTLVLQTICKKKNDFNLHLIPGHTIKKLIVHDKLIDDDNKKSFERLVIDKMTLNSIDMIKEAKENILKMLDKNKLPCKLDNLDKTIIVNEICKIREPYREQDIECDNYKVVKNLKNLLKDVFLGQNKKRVN